MEFKHLHYSQPVTFESGEVLPELRIAYNTFGTINEDRDNVVWIIHALTANSNPLEWWSDMVGIDKPIDPNKHFIVCANALGSHYGTTCPLDINPLTNQPYYHSFPQYTIRDMVKVYAILKNHLGIDKIKLLVGPSIGGQQAIEWAIEENDSFEKLLLIATNANHSAWGIAFNESQRMAIEADSTWLQGGSDAGMEGLKCARSIALLSYRTIEGYNITQKEQTSKIDHFKASSYQRYQGLKLANRFNTYSYYLLSKAMDSHDVGRERESRAAALSRIKAETTIAGISSDILFPIHEQKFLHDMIPKSKFTHIDSKFGHDGFLVEKDLVGEILQQILK